MKHTHATRPCSLQALLHPVRFFHSQTPPASPHLVADGAVRTLSRAAQRPSLLSLPPRLAAQRGAAPVLLPHRLGCQYLAAAQRARQALVPSQDLRQRVGVGGQL